MYKAILYPALSSRVILNNQARLACCYDQAPASGNVQGIPRETSREFGEFPGVPLEFPWNFPVISLDPLISLEFLWKFLWEFPWNIPWNFSGIPWNSKFRGNSLEISGISLELPWYFPDQGVSGNSMVFLWNSSGKITGISLEFPWNPLEFLWNFPDAGAWL